MKGADLAIYIIEIRFKISLVPQVPLFPVAPQVPLIPIAATIYMLMISLCTSHEKLKSLMSLEGRPLHDKY